MYIISEEQLDGMEYYLPLKNRLCHKDSYLADEVRSRPYHPAPEQRCMDCVYLAKVLENAVEACNEARQSERENVLDKVIEILDGDMTRHVQGELHDKIQSLRSKLEEPK